MKLVSPYESREKFLVFGPQKAGKSTALLSLATRNTEDQFYVLDTEGKMQYTIERNFGELPNVHITDISEMQFIDILGLIKNELTPKAGENDWLDIDSITETWTMVANQTSERKFGATKEAYWETFFDTRPKADMNKDAQLELPYLQVINPLYYKLYNLLQKWPGHVFATAQVTQIKDKDAADIRKMFGSIGVRPDGQKKLAHVFHEILYLECDREGVHRMSSFGTSSGVQFRDVEFSDWAKDYLMLKAGWKFEKSGE